MIFDALAMLQHKIHGRSTRSRTKCDGRRKGGKKGIETNEVMVQMEIMASKKCRIA